MGFALLNFSIKMSDIECIHCHTTFAVTDEAHTLLRQTGKGFWCPLCHGSMTYSDNENGRLRKELEAEKARKLAILNEANSLRETKRQLEKRLTAQRGATKRLSNRIKHGVCPCCTRTFSNLAAHMETKHPEFKA